MGSLTHKGENNISNTLWDEPNSMNKPFPMAILPLKMLMVCMLAYQTTFL